MNTINETMISDTEYVNLSLELAGKIYNKNYNGFAKVKEDMIQHSLLQLWSARNKFDSTKGNIKSFICAIIYNSYNVYLRDNVYRDKDVLTSLDKNVNDEEETTLLDTIGKIDLEYQNIEYIELLKEFDDVIAMRNKGKFNKINAEELHIIMDMLMDGYKQKNISKKLNVSSVTINRKINLIKDIITEIKKGEINMNGLIMIENDKNFIPVYKTDKNIKVVKGRELHEGLCVKKDFTNWIKNQLEIVDAVENTDFFRFAFKVEGNNATLHEYILKIETAKEICLVAGASNRANPELKKKSKEYRRYLINVEEKYKKLQNQLIQSNTILPKELKCEMDDFIKEVKEIKSLVNVKKKYSDMYVKQIKRYLGINKISDDKYGYNTIKDMFLSKFEVDKFEDITVSPENILELDKICKSYKKEFKQISIFD